MKKSPMRMSVNQRPNERDQKDAKVRPEGRTWRPSNEIGIKRRASRVALDVDRGSKRQAFHPNIHSEAVKRIGAGRNDAIPLRLRDLLHGNAKRQMKG